jgi:hypothetical protein
MSRVLVCNGLYAPAALFLSVTKPLPKFYSVYDMSHIELWTAQIRSPRNGLKSLISLPVGLRRQYCRRYPAHVTSPTSLLRACFANILVCLVNQRGTVLFLIW